MKMKYQNLIRQMGFRMKQKKLFALRSSPFTPFFVGLFLAGSLASAVYAEVKSQEPALYGVLEGDLLTEANPVEPNSLTNIDVAPEKKGTDSLISEGYENRKTVSENDLLIAKGPVTLVERQLWQARTRAIEDKEDSESKDELQQMIRRISSIKLKPAVQPAVTEVVVEQPQETEPSQDQKDDSDEKVLHEQEDGKVEIDSAEGYISEQTLQMLQGFLQQPGELNNTLELAEILFNSGCLKEAAICYRQALNQASAQVADPFQDKAWILLQLGNCLQKEDPQAALESYRAVITESPDSLWAPLAKAKSELTNWYLQDQPKTLVHNSKL